MKKLLFKLSLMFLPLLTAAQTMNVHMKSGGVNKINISEIDYVDFSLTEDGVDENPVYYPDVVKANYAAAFVSKFGQPHPNQSWGFRFVQTRSDSSGRKIRIIAEDLVSNDFDFNDVVFDVEEVGEQWKITLLAVGTTTPIHILNHEAHELFGVSTDIMVNVGPSSRELSPVSFMMNPMPNLGDIIVKSVVKENINVRLWATMGEPPAMIAVNTNYEWCEERRSIENKHRDFVSWVRGDIHDWYTPEGNTQIDVTIGDNVYVDDSGQKQAWNALYYQLSQVNGTSKNIEARYTGIISDPTFKAPVNPSLQMLNDFWIAPYTLINQNRMMRSNAPENNKASAIAICDILDALAYEELTSYFGDVPYLTDDVNPMDYLPRTAVSTIIDNLITRISQSKSSAINRKGKVITNLSGLDELSSVSVDLADLVLAELYMSKGDYQTAKNNLLNIINSGHYSFWSTTRHGLNGNEILLSMNGYEADESIVRTYSDVLLLCAECENTLGNVSASKSYITQVTQAKGLEVDVSDPAKAIAQVRQSLQTQTNGFFAYLKRCGLAQELLGLEDYQLLLPLPFVELNKNPSITQNPGY